MSARRSGRIIANLMKMKIEWEKVKELSDGHGVLFIHNEIKKPIAFLVGYKWLHEEPDKVTVEILQDEFLLKVSQTLNIKKIIVETKREIRLFIKNKVIKKYDSSEGPVRVWYNA
jgi:hypothetical protein